LISRLNLSWGVIETHQTCRHMDLGKTVIEDVLDRHTTERHTPLIRFSEGGSEAVCAV
jgi:hypothetical protein